MKRLHKLVLKSFIGPFFLIFFIVMFILLMQFLWRYIDDMVGKGLDFSIIAELLLYTSASLVPMALPLAILMSALMTFGNMGEYNELTAIKASGISLQRVLRPVIILVVFISIGAFLFANNVMPYTNLKMRSLLYDVRQQRPELQIKAGEFYNGIEGYSIRINKKNPETNMLYGLRLYDHTQRSGNTNAIVSDSGTMKMTKDERYLVVTLYNGYSYNEEPEDKKNRRNRRYPHRLDKFKKQEFLIELVGFNLERTDENLFKNNYQMMNLSQLKYMKDSMLTDISDFNNNFQRVIKINNYFKVRNPVRRPAKAVNSRPGLNINDSIIKEPVIFDFDSLFNSLTDNEKLRVISQAMSFARSTKGYIQTNSNNLDFKVKRLRKYEIEWQRKFTVSVACLLFLLIGAPLGAIIRKGGLGMPVVISTLFFIFYYVISLIGEKFVRESMLLDYQGMWVSSLIILIIGVFLTYKATTDSVLMNIETYRNFFKRLRMIFQKYLPVRQKDNLHRVSSGE
ncbi:MAG: LptF/LptG family permease [Bacteroidales bacterium]|nr:LptF/LptG family permease [Bacteroidales bacterium]